MGVGPAGTRIHCDNDTVLFLAWVVRNYSMAQSPFSILVIGEKARNCQNNLGFSLRFRGQPIYWTLAPRGLWFSIRTEQTSITDVSKHSNLQRKETNASKRTTNMSGSQAPWRPDQIDYNREQAMASFGAIMTCHRKLTAGSTS